MNSRTKVHDDQLFLESTLGRLLKKSGADFLDTSLPLVDFDIDSLDIVESIFELEQLYGKSLTSVEIQSITTIDDLLRILKGNDTSTK